MWLRLQRFLRQSRQRRVARHTNRRVRHRGVSFEALEPRRLLTGVLPYGAAANDTAEYMLGTVLVSVVFMESDPTLAPRNASTADWTPQQISDTEQKVREGVTWWESTLQARFPGTVSPLHFQFDMSHADTPVHTGYEPINHPSDDFVFWIYDFLNPAGYGSTKDFNQDIRDYNNAQRLKYGTDWAFTVFVVNDANSTGQFQPGSFKQAFSYPGGEFIVSPSGRPASTFAHETGHMFWAKDEYHGSGATYADYRGYYNTQNWNQADNPTAGFVQVDSIMANGTRLDNAYANHTSSPSSLDMIGWRDSNGNGVMDVLDVSNTLTGTGYFDPQTGTYRFVGSSAVRPLTNLNTAGLQNDITLNEIDRAEYSLDGGAWQSIALTPTYAASLDLSIPVTFDGLSHSVRIRTKDSATGVTSAEFQGDVITPSSVAQPGISGFVWSDTNQDGAVNNAEYRLSGWNVQVVDGAGKPLNLGGSLDPDSYSMFTTLNTVSPDVTLKALGELVDAAGTVVAVTGNPASTGVRVFANSSQLVAGFTPKWTQNDQQLSIKFAKAVGEVRLDAIGIGTTSSYGRLEAYDAQGRLLTRYTTNALGAGTIETMVVSRSSADIDHVLARAHRGTTIELDNLRYGPTTSTLTDARGAYAFTGLPAGTYQVRATPPSGTAPVLPTQAVTLTAAGQAVSSASGVNFASPVAIISWQNPVYSVDVNGDGTLTPLDALSVINYLNTHLGFTDLPPLPATPTPYYDVDGNGALTALDVLQIVNALNSPAKTGTSSSSAKGITALGPGALLAAAPGAPSLAATGGAAGEGESAKKPSSRLATPADTRPWPNSVDYFFSRVGAAGSPARRSPPQASRQPGLGELAIDEALLDA